MIVKWMEKEQTCLSNQNNRLQINTAYEVSDFFIFKKELKQVRSA